MDYQNLPFNHHSFGLLKMALKLCQAGGDIDVIDTKEELEEAVQEFFDNVEVKPK